jgi:hypothetical protein
MKPSLYIIPFGLILFSCSQKRIEKLNGLWRLDFDGQIESPFYPHEIYFEADSFILIDGHSFKHRISYQIVDDSIEMIFSNNSIRKLYFDSKSDSVIFIGDGKFMKISDDYEIQSKPYELIGYITNELLIDSSFSNIIHLVKNSGEVKVILNDVTTELEIIEEFLAPNHDTPPPLILYLGKGLDFNDLIKAYMWIRRSNTHVVTLVTGNDSFDTFYTIKDTIGLDDSLTAYFSKTENIPHAPPQPVELSDTKRHIIEIKNLKDLEKLENLTETTKYLIHIDNRLDLLAYFELIEKIKGKKNVKKVITTTQHGS